jgi:hypothetical protein
LRIQKKSQHPGGSPSIIWSRCRRAALSSGDPLVSSGPTWKPTSWPVVADIAHELAYAESTIKKEVHIIVHRLGAKNRTHAVAMAIRGDVI